MTNSSAYVLILEPDADARRELGELFSEAGYEVEQETLAGRAVTRVLRRDPSVVVMAERTPRLDSVDVLPLMRRLTKAPIVVTGDGDDTSSVVRVLLDGGDAFIGRPLNGTELMARVRALLRRSESTRGCGTSEGRGISPRARLGASAIRESTTWWTRLASSLSIRRALAVPLPSTPRLMNGSTC